MPGVGQVWAIGVGTSAGIVTVLVGATGVDELLKEVVEVVLGPGVGTPILHVSLHPLHNSPPQRRLGESRVQIGDPVIVV